MSSRSAPHYFFARPGAEVRFDVEIPIVTDFRITAGAATQVYLPQGLDGTGGEWRKIGHLPNPPDPTRHDPPVGMM